MLTKYQTVFRLLFLQRSARVTFHDVSLRKHFTFNDVSHFSRLKLSRSFEHHHFLFIKKARMQLIFTREGEGGRKQIESCTF